MYLVLTAFLKRIVNKQNFIPLNLFLIMNTLKKECSKWKNVRIFIKKLLENRWSYALTQVGVRLPHSTFFCLFHFYHIDEHSDSHRIFANGIYALILPFWSQTTFHKQLRNDNFSFS